MKWPLRQKIHYLPPFEAVPIVYRAQLVLWATCNLQLKQATNQHLYWLQRKIILILRSQQAEAAVCKLQTGVGVGGLVYLPFNFHPYYLTGDIFLALKARAIFTQKLPQLAHPLPCLFSHPRRGRGESNQWSSWSWPFKVCLYSALLLINYGERINVLSYH